MKSVGGKKKGGNGRKMKDRVKEKMNVKGMEISVIKLFGFGEPWKSLAILIFFS